MSEAFLIDHPWVAVALWAALYISDYYLTLWGARLYKETASAFIDFDGSYELEPLFKRDIDALRRVSPRFLWRLLLSGLALLGYWWLVVRLVGFPDLFLVLLGGYVLLEGVVHLRHIRSIVAFRAARVPGALEGRLKYARWVTEHLSIAELTSFGVFFLVCYALSGRVIFLGGALGCLVTAARFHKMARRRGQIRPATSADARAVARVHVASWAVAYRGIMPDDVIAKMDLPRRTEWWEKAIAVPEWPVFVLERAGEIIAFCHMTASRDADADPKRVGEITSIHVLPARAGKGLGRQLLTRAFTEFRKRGYREVTLWVLTENADARRFYEKVGFWADGGTKTYPETEVPEVRYRIGLTNEPERE